MNNQLLEIMNHQVTDNQINQVKVHLVNINQHQVLKMENHRISVTVYRKPHYRMVI